MATPGRPLIFWEQQALERQKKAKKFTYKTRDQKFQLRSKGKAVEQETSPPMKASHQPVQNNQPRQKRSNGETEARRAADRAGGAKPAGKRTDWEALGRRGKGHIGTGTVTLTQAQLDTILETVGRLALDKENLRTAATSAAVELSTQDKATSFSKPPSGKDSRQNPDTVLNVTDLNRPSVDPAADRTNIGSVAARTETEKSRHQSSFNGGQPEGASDGVPQRATVNEVQKTTARVDVKWSAMSPEDHPMPGGPQRSTLPTPIPMAHMTKAERKRLQWERERAEEAQFEEFNPWGRPGGGAPIRDRQGNMLNDYNTRKSFSEPVAPSDDTQESEDLIFQEKLDKVKTRRQISDPPPQPPQSTFPGKPAQPGPPAQFIHPPVNGVSSTTAPQVEPSVTDVLPPAIRSNFVIGEPRLLEVDSAPDANMYNTANELKRQEWLRELEKQREEQQQRRLKEKQRWKQLDGDDNWADRFTSHPNKPADQTTQQVSPRATVDDTAAVMVAPSGQTELDTSRSFSAPMGTLEGSAEPLGSTFLRGQNMMVDPVTRHEMEEKRRRHLEHQEFIRKQVEEKEQAKRAEREQKRREEEVEEARLKRERDDLQRQFELEQKKKHNKEETQQRKVDMLKEAMDRAQEEAEREKHEKRLHRLHQGGHDTSRLHANFEEPELTLLTQHQKSRQLDQSYGHSDHRQAASHGDGATTQQSDVALASTSAMVAAPVDAASRTQLTYEPYTENRVLTPSVYRASQGPLLSPGREFGTQTDPKLPRTDQHFDRDDTEIEYRGPGAPPRGRTRPTLKKTVRVKSNADAQSRTKSRQVAPAVENPPPAEAKRRTKPVKISERPRWGAPKTQPQKVPKKQSERDPFYEQKRRRAEMMKAERQREMLALAAANSPHVAQETTAASRARSHSRHDKSPGGGTHRSESPRLDGHVSRVESHMRQYNRRSRSPPRTDTRLTNRRHSTSPPIPAIKHKLGYNQSTSDVNGYDHQRTVYRDSNPVEPPVDNGEFVPFIRSMDVLDPAHADSPIQLSRENSAAERARIAYLQEHAPGTYGVHMTNYNDSRIKPPVKDPIMNHGLVTDHPTGRQDRILQQLSDLRRGLMMKQRELEMGLSVAPSANGHNTEDSGY